jgi:hypothetical protein
MNHRFITAFALAALALGGLSGPAAAQVQSPVAEHPRPVLHRLVRHRPAARPVAWGVGAAGARHPAESGAKPLSPAAASLARRLLATAANAPDGAGADGDLAGARVRALIALGDVADANAILDRTPNLAASASLSQAAAETALIAGDDAKACQIGDTVTTDRGAIYWVRLRAFCQLKAGDTGRRPADLHRRQANSATSSTPG